MTTSVWTEWGVEIWATDGPTGEFREVLELAVRDYGNNELWRGVPGQQPAYRIPVRLAATKLGQLIAGADQLCDYADDENTTAGLEKLYNVAEKRLAGLGLDAELIDDASGQTTGDEHLSWLCDASDEEIRAWAESMG